MGRKRDNESQDSDNDIIKPPKRMKRQQQLPVEIITREIKSINDLIELGESYDPKAKKTYNIDLRTLSYMANPLRDLQSLIGMEKVKQNILVQILYFLQNMHKGNIDMLHCVIQGPPGVGKTELAKIIGRIYSRMGILETGIFIIAKRSDLVGKYLGQTAIKTQNVIDDAYGGVLLIDEAYSLGNEEGRDSFSKECIDTLNQNLTENKNNFMCIIAGYEDALEKCFFSVNPGLQRRFNFKYTIDGYSPSELRQILVKLIKDQLWSYQEPIESALPLQFFKENIKLFTNYGGDMETLFFNIKMCHSQRVFCLPIEQKTVITKEDLENGMKMFAQNKKIIPNKKEMNPSIQHLYI